MKIGVLALQGAFIEHIAMLKSLGVDCFEIRQKKDAEKSFDGLILPGGESTVIAKLARENDIFDTLLERINHNMPVFGTCAGMILLAKNIANDDKKHFATMDITVQRNAFGRQLASFACTEKFNDNLIEMRFIRAPYVKSFGENVKVLSVYNDKIVAVAQNNQLAVAFHPELTKDSSVHKYFLNMIN